MDNNYSVHILGVLPNSNLWSPVCEVFRSLLLDARHFGIQ